MLGYTIEDSIDRLEKRMKKVEESGGGGGASTWNQLEGKPFEDLGNEFYNLDNNLTLRVISSDKISLPDSEHYIWEDVSEAIEGISEELGHVSTDIVDITTNINSLSTGKQDILIPGANISIVDNTISILIRDITAQVTINDKAYIRNGKIFKLANLLIIDIDVQVTSNIAVDETLISGLPIPSGGRMLNCMQYNTTNRLNLLYHPQGRIQPKSALNATYAYSINGFVYIPEV